MQSDHARLYCRCLHFLLREKFAAAPEHRAGRRKIFQTIAAAGGWTRGNKGSQPPQGRRLQSKKSRSLPYHPAARFLEFKALVECFRAFKKAEESSRMVEFSRITERHLMACRDSLVFPEERAASLAVYRRRPLKPRRCKAGGETVAASDYPDSTGAQL